MAGVKVREENNVEDQNAVQDQEPLNDGEAENHDESGEQLTITDGEKQE